MQDTFFIGPDQFRELHVAVIDAHVESLADELLDIEEFDEEIVTEIRRRARDALLTQLIAKEEVLDENAPEQDLLDLEGMNERLAYRLAENGVRSQEDLAELSVDELKEFDEMSDEEAAALIMAARAPWFAEEQ